MATHKKQYEVYEVSVDGLLKAPEFNEGYGYSSNLYGPFDTEDEAITALLDKAKGGGKWIRWQFIIVPRITILGENT